MDRFATNNMKTGPGLTDNEELAYGWETYEEAAAQLPLYEAALGTRLLIEPPGPATASFIESTMNAKPPVRYRIIERTLKVIRTGENPGFCNVYYKNVETGAKYCTVYLGSKDEDPKFHTFCGEPEAPFRDDIHVIEVDKKGNQIKVWQ